MWNASTYSIYLHAPNNFVIFLYLFIYMNIISSTSFPPETSPKEMAMAKEPPPLYPNTPSLLIEALLYQHLCHACTPLPYPSSHIGTSYSFLFLDFLPQLFKFS